MNKTPLIVTGAAAALVLGGGTSAFAMTHEVDVTVYGKHSSARTFGGKVEDVLAGQGVNVKPTDKVTPALNAPVNDSTQIVVQKQHSVKVTVDGRTTTSLTPASTVGQALTGYKLPAGAHISPAPSTALGEQTTAITVSTARTVTFTGQYGKATTAVKESTVGAAAKAHLGNVQGTDRYFDGAGHALAATAPVTDGMTIRIQRIRTAETVAHQKVPFSTVTVKDKDLPEGTTKVTTEGKDGARDVTTRTTTVDGKVTSTQVISTKATAKAVDKVVAHGTKAAEAAPAASSSDSTASAAPESSSSSTTSSAATTAAPAAKQSTSAAKTQSSSKTSSASKTQSSSKAQSSSKSASASTTQSSSNTQSAAKAQSTARTSGAAVTCKASHYGLNDGTDGGPTASGETFHASGMTAAHKTLKLGTRIKVTNKANGKSVIVRINDRGPYVSGRCLDLSSGAFSRIGSLGSGTMTVTYQRVS